jgi:hypothetical protein
MIRSVRFNFPSPMGPRVVHYIRRVEQEDPGDGAEQYPGPMLALDEVYLKLFGPGCCLGLGAIHDVHSKVYGVAVVW